MADYDRMMNDVVSKYGFEAEESIQFCIMCAEDADFHDIAIKYMILMDCY